MFFVYNQCFRNPAFRHFASQHIDLLKTLKAEKCWHVSSHGRCCDTKGRISQGCMHGSGYLRVNISNHLFYVHRVIALAFLGAPSDHAWQVHHRDGNIVNNHVKNLEYVTPAENMKYYFAGKAEAQSKLLQSKPVLWRHAGSNQWTHSTSMRSTARQLGLSLCTVSRCCHNQSAAQGFEFQFADVNTPDLPGEEWLPMLHPETGSKVRGRMVSSLGRVQSCRGIVNRGHLSKQGYYQTRCSGQFLTRNQSVHRLVAYAFLGKPPSEQQRQINHKDGDKGNNAVENLEYVTPSQNCIHFHSLAKSNNSHLVSRASQCKPVWSRAFKSNHDWQWHASMSRAAVILGLDPSSISRCCRGLWRQTGGFEFHKADPAHPAEVIEGEEWRKVDVPALIRDRAPRARWWATFHMTLVKLKLGWKAMKMMWFKPSRWHHRLGLKDTNHATQDVVRMMKPPHVAEVASWRMLKWCRHEKEPLNTFVLSVSMYEESRSGQFHYMLHLIM